MELGLSPAGLAGLSAVLLIAGLVAGFLSGLLGIGGGGILVPVLFEVFSFWGVDPAIRMHMTLGTSLAIILPTAAKSFSGHYARGSVDSPVIRRMGPYVLAGVVAGLFVAGQASSAALRWVWVVMAAAVAIKMALGRDDWRLGDDLPRPPALELAAGGIGFVSTLMSIGGATFVVPLLTLYGRPILRAIATATGVGMLIAIPGALGYAWLGSGVAGLPPLSLGYVNLAAVLLIAPVSVLAAPFGVRAAHGISKRKLELAFAGFLMCVVLRFLWTLLG